MSRLFTAILAVLAVLLTSVLLAAGAPARAAQPARAAAKDDGAVGWLYVRQFVPDTQRDEFQGFKEGRLFVYDDAGAALPSDRPGGHYLPGQLVALPEGWYGAEVGEFPTPLNRWRYYVKAGQVTVVRTGLVMVPTPNPAEQPSDLHCTPWRAELHAFVWDETGALKLVAGNGDTPVQDFGMLQLHEGRYAFSFNKLLAVHEIQAERTLSLPTAQIGPLPHSPYRISMRADDAAETPSVTLCKDRPTQVLAGDYVGSHYIDTMQPPFRKRVWEEQAVTAPGGVRYQKAPVDKGLAKKTLYRGEGSRPTRVVSVPVTDPLPRP